MMRLHNLNPVPNTRSSTSFNLIRLVTFIMVLSVSALAQTVTVPLSHWVYDQLDRWEAQGLIENVYNHSRPYSRPETAEYLSEVFEAFANSPEQFSTVDQEYLTYCAIEFSEDLKSAGVDFSAYSNPNRFEPLRETQVFSWLPDAFYGNNRNMYAKTHDEFRLFVDPVAQYSRYETVSLTDSVYDVQRTSNGLLAYGNLGPHFNFYFNLTDNHFSRDPGYPIQEVLEESGLPYHTARVSESFDIDENAAYIMLSSDHFLLLYGRDYNQWGSGRQSQMMLSTNAPIYDQVKFTVRYWRFKYTHITAFLQYIPPDGRISIKRFEPTDAYWAGNRLEMYLGKGIQLGLQQSIIYGNQSLKPGYLNPLSFFKSLEHFYGDRDNGALGIDIAWRLPSFIRSSGITNGAKLTGELFLDELRTSKLGTDWFGNKFGYQAGLLVVDPLKISGTDLYFEYARVNPYVYTHALQDYNKYKHYDTILGHFIGPNSDNLFLRLRYSPTRRTRLELYVERYRHGSNIVENDTTVIRNVGGDPDLPRRSNIDSESVSFLDGDLITRRAVGAEARYELFRSGFITLRYQQVTTQSDQSFNTIALRLSLNLGQREEKMPLYETALH